MRNYLKILVGLVAVLIRVETAHAQLDNRAFTSSEPGVLRNPDVVPPPIGTLPGLDSTRLQDAEYVQAHTFEKGDLRLALNAFVFFKDNEYFNKIVMATCCTAPS